LQAINPNVYVAPAGFTNFGVPITTSQVLTASGNEIFEIDLSARPSTAVGFDAYLNDPQAYDSVTTMYFGATGNLIATVIDSRGPGAPFLGVLADEPIFRIVWTAVGGDQINTGIDNLRLGSAIPSGPAEPVLVNGLVSMTLGAQRFDRATNQTLIPLTITNISTTAIGGPVRLAIPSISTSLVTLANATSATGDGSPCIDLTASLSDGRLNPDESLTVSVSFSNPRRLRFTFTYDLFGIATDE
jgi:hypothetical protein